MKNRILNICVALMLCGCASLPHWNSLITVRERKLAKAVILLEQGKTVAARDLLAILCAEPGVPRITDEALFRLSVLRLGTVYDKNDTLQARHDLERLKKEYPASSWAHLAESLLDYLTTADDLRQQNKKNKDQNFSIIKENNELRQSIEKLKNLELEMGKRNKH